MERVATLEREVRTLQPQADASRLLKSRNKELEAQKEVFENLSNDLSLRVDCLSVCSTHVPQKY